MLVEHMELKEINPFKTKHSSLTVGRHTPHEIQKREGASIG